jgi:hypothetical protein
MKITLTNRNTVGKVVLSTGGVSVSSAGNNTLAGLNDVITANQADGDVVTFQANTNNYVVKPLVKADGGTF